jgi:D-serine deaminase-like pyridoxal phosphate-dependent protein
MRQAIGVMMSVMSVHRTHAVLDGGLKAVSVDSGAPAPRLPGWRVRGVSDEHTVIEPVDASVAAPPLALGSRIVLDPGHCDPTVNLHDHVVAFRGDRVEAVWQVLARGASR